MRKKIGSKISKGLSTIKTRIQKTKNTFKDQFNEARQKPISKRKSGLLGFSTVLTIFGITMLGPVLPAVAEQIPAPNPPKPSPNPIFNQKIREGIGGFAAAVCAGAATSGSFLLGAACGLAVVAGILISKSNKG